MNDKTKIDWTQPIEVYHPSTGERHPARLIGVCTIAPNASRWPRYVETEHATARACEDGSDFGANCFVRNVPRATGEATLPSGETLSVGDVAVSKAGTLYRVDQMAGEEFIVSFWDEALLAWFQCNDCRYKRNGHVRFGWGTLSSAENRNAIVRLATPSDFPDSMPEDQIPAKYVEDVRRVRRSRAAKAEQARDYAKAVTPKGRSVEFWNDLSNEPGCWAAVDGNSDLLLWVGEGRGVRESMLSLRDIGREPNRWPWPDVTLVNIDAYLDAREAPPAVVVADAEPDVTFNAVPASDWCRADRYAWAGMVVGRRG